MRVAGGGIWKTRDDIWETSGPLRKTSSDLRVTSSAIEVAICANSRISSDLRIALLALRNATYHN